MPSARRRMGLNSTRTLVELGRMREGRDRPACLCRRWLHGASVRVRSEGGGCGEDDLDCAARSLEGRGSSSVGGGDRGDDREPESGSDARSAWIGGREAVEGVLGEAVGESGTIVSDLYDNAGRLAGGRDRDGPASVVDRVVDQ